MPRQDKNITKIGSAKKALCPVQLEGECQHFACVINQVEMDSSARLLHNQVEFNKASQQRSC